MLTPKKLPQPIVDFLMPRLADEYTAHYHYRHISNYLRGIGFIQAADYFFAESESELEHAKGIEKFLVDWNVLPMLPAIASPNIKLNGLVSCIEHAYNLEYDLYEKYEETSIDVWNAGDICVFDFLQRYRTIQRESVAEYSDMINLLQGVDLDDKFKLIDLQEELFGE